MDAEIGSAINGKERWVLGTQLKRQAQDRPDRTFVVDEVGEEVSYAEALRRSNKLAAGLAKLGVQQGDHVVMVMNNSVDLLLAWFAINLLGGVEVPLNTANRGASLEHAFNNSGAEIAVVDAEYLPWIADSAQNLWSLRRIVVRGVENAATPWTTEQFSVVAACADSAPTVEVSYWDVGAIMYTSGTSGPAKGVLMSHAHMYLFARHVVEQLRIDASDTYLVCLPLFHGNAQLMQVYAAMQAGAKVALYGRFSATSWLQQIRESGATVSSLLGVMAQFIYDQAESVADRAHNLRRMVTIPLPGSIAEHFEERFRVRCVEAYGMTEVCLPLYCDFDDELQPGSCGKPLEGWFEVDILDPDTDEPVPVGKSGEIVVRPKSAWTTFLGYHAMPERTVEAWRNLWFHTGDAGRRDEHGYFYFEDRLKDRIRRRGENVSSYDVEVAVGEFPGVSEVAAVAVPASEGEDDIKVFIVTEGSVDELALREYCRSRLPYFALPRYVEPVETLPKTPSGKVLKRELRARGVTGGEWDERSTQSVASGR